MKTVAGKDKVANTKLEKYGDSKYNNRDKFRETIESFSIEEKNKITEGRKLTVLAEYGVEYITQTDIFKAKAKETNLGRYGFENAASSKLVKDKIAASMVKKFGGHYAQQHLTADTIEKLSSIEYLTNNANRSLVEIGRELGVTYYTVGYAYDKYNITRTFEGYNRSDGEREVCEYLSSIGIEIQENVRGIIGQKELDIYSPTKKLGIEYNGLYWHCENRGKDKTYHLNKTIACKEKGIDLIHITEYEWEHKKDIVKSRLVSKLGVSQYIVYGRNCIIREVSARDTEIFLSATHIQGFCLSKIRYGLYHNNVLVAVMTFGQARYDKSVKWELLRYSTNLNTSVIGGANKLFKHFVKQHSPVSVVSYSDRRWNTGNMYSKLGFNFIKNSGPNYWYVKQYATFESRVRYQKHKLAKLLENFDPNITEWDNMVANGYDRFWDCGNSVWHWFALKPALTV
jgi:hypothetical protein